MGAHAAPWAHAPASWAATGGLAAAAARPPRRALAAGADSAGWRQAAWFAGDTTIGGGWGVSGIEGASSAPSLRRTRERGPGRVVAVDGPGGSGKSTVARAVARQLGFDYLDTGSTYRAVTWLALQHGTDLRDDEAVATVAELAVLDVGTDPAAPSIAVNGRRVDDEVRSDAVNAAVSAVSAVPEVRRRLVALQQRVIAAAGDVVIEGRDTGAVVAPTAAVKVYLTAREDVRAARRAREQGRDDADALARTAAALGRRDSLDSSRSVSPLTVAPGAVVIDTSTLAVDDVVRQIIDLVPDRDTDEGTNSNSNSDSNSDAVGVGRRAAGPVGPSVASAAARTATGRRAADLRPAAAPSYRPWLLTLLRHPARAIARLAFRFEVRGVEHVPSSGPVLIAGNHSGFLDGPLVAAFSPRLLRIMAKDELYRGPLGVFLHLVGQIPVRRGRPDRAALRACLEVLRGGAALGIFPEGTRGTGELEQVQDGAAYLLLRVNCPVVPVVCLGTRAALPTGSRWPRWRSPVTVVFGPSLTVVRPANPRARRAVAVVAEQVRVGLADHLHQVRRGQR